VGGEDNVAPSLSLRFAKGMAVQWLTGRGVRGGKQRRSLGQETLRFGDCWSRLRFSSRSTLRASCTEITISPEVSRACLETETETGRRGKAEAAKGRRKAQGKGRMDYICGLCSLECVFENVGLRKGGCAGKLFWAGRLSGSGLPNACCSHVLGPRLALLRQNVGCVTEGALMLRRGRGFLGVQMGACAGGGHETPVP
jgi:hypothetical protein